MAQIIHDISLPNDGLGDPLRTGFGNQNAMNTELYTTKVDKVTGKELSSNNYDNAAVSKLAGIEAGAQVNVPVLWENIIGAPTELFSSVGYFDYNDSATAITPLNFTSGVGLQLTNNTLGAFTDRTQAPYNVSNIWDPLTNTFDFNELSVGDTVDFRIDLNFTTSGANAIVKCFLRMQEGTAGQYDVFVGDKYFKTAAANENVKFDISAYIGSNAERINPAKLIIVSDTNGSTVVNGWYTRIIRKGINIVDLGSAYVKKSISQNFSYNNTGSNVVLPLQYNGASFLTLTNSGLISLSGFDLSLITGFANAESPFEGKRFFIFNNTLNSVNLLYGAGSEIPFLFRSGTNISIPTGEILEVVYSGGSFLDTFRSWDSGGGGVTTTLQKTVLVSRELNSTDNECILKIKANVTLTIPASGLQENFNYVARTFSGATLTNAAAVGVTTDAQTGLILKPFKMQTCFRDANTQTYIITGETSI